MRFDKNLFFSVSLYSSSGSIFLSIFQNFYLLCIGEVFFSFSKLAFCECMTDASCSPLSFQTRILASLSIDVLTIHEHMETTGLLTLVGWTGQVILTVLLVCRVSFNC